MAEDPYKVLGVARGASAVDIKRAFHKLAKKWHPDLNPGDKAAETRFKAITGANELLSDPERRAAFDRGEVDANGQGQPPPNYRGYAEGAQGGRYRGGTAAAGFTEDDLGDIFGDLFGKRARSGGPASGRDEMYALSVDFLDAVNGATKRLALPDGQNLDVKVPAGLESGQTLRLRGKGGPGAGGGPAGDALIEVTVGGHPFFRREGVAIHLELPVTLREAVLGAKISVPTPRGAVTMTVPARSDSGRQLRLRGRGVAANGSREAGDLYVTLRVTVGTPDAALEDFLRDWTREEADPTPGDDGGVMMTVEMLCVEVRGLCREDVERWIDEEWVRPDGTPTRYLFRDIDVARVRLIVELRDHLRLDEDALPVVLSLMDQLYEERRRLRRLRDAMVAVPEEARVLIGALASDPMS